MKIRRFHLGQFLLSFSYIFANVAENASSVNGEYQHQYLATPDNFLFKQFVMVAEISAFTTFYVYLFAFFVAAPRTSLAGLQSTITALPCANYKTEMLDSLLPIPTHTYGLWQIITNERSKTNVRIQHVPPVRMPKWD